jgi:hypothetical protein
VNEIGWIEVVTLLSDQVADVESGFIHVSTFCSLLGAFLTGVATAFPLILFAAHIDAIGNVNKIVVLSVGETGVPQKPRMVTACWFSPMSETTGVCSGSQCGR